MRKTTSPEIIRNFSAAANFYHQTSKKAGIENKFNVAATAAT